MSGGSRPGQGHNGGPPLVEFAPQPGPQAALLTCPVEDIMFGGARGGGKTYGMLLDWMKHALAHGRFANGIFFRRIGVSLEEVIQEAHRILPHFGGRWMKQAGTYVFTSGPAKGARLKFRHLWDVKAADGYQGHAYTWICCEELTQWPIKLPIDMIRATLRSGNGVPCVFRSTANPGGAGHHWVKALYVEPNRAGYEVIVDPESGERRVFIPSTLENNRILTTSDPRYEARLRALGSHNLVKAWRYGDWDIVEDGMFKRHWLPIVDAVPAGMRMVRKWDLAATLATGSNDPDWTAGVKMGRGSDGIFYITDIVRFRGTALDVERAVYNTATADSKKVTVGLSQDPGQAGKAQVQAMIRMLAGWNVKSAPESGSKEVRAAPFAAQCEAGNVRMLRGAWNEPFFAEAEIFPTGPHDDQIDGAAGAFELLADGSGPQAWVDHMEARTAALRNPT
ncbi:hypothetical protein HMP06_0462 [Sphingomonas sp. HMP6]|nr:hypothetical protein HMP06_0462 [Sphingomonas sp. HMP6]